MTRRNSTAAMARSARRLVKMIELDAPDILIERELNLLAHRTTDWREEVLDARTNMAVHIEALEAEAAQTNDSGTDNGAVN